MDEKAGEKVVTLGAHGGRSPPDRAENGKDARAKVVAADSSAAMRQHRKDRAEERAISGAFGAERDGDTGPDLHASLDHATQAWLSRFTHGISPAALMGAWFDWATHMVAAPGKRLQLAEKAGRKARRFTRYALECGVAGGQHEHCIEPLPQDNRFRDEAWRTVPFNLFQQGFLLQQQWWHNVVSGVPGVTAQHERELQFLIRQMLDTVAPSNFLLTNPEVLKKTQQENGLNLVRGLQNFLQDAQRAMVDAAPLGADAFQPARDVAVTDGQVVHRNRLMELIQYAPRTKSVRPEPIMIVPAWIMKYYILDLSPHNSMVRYLVEQGYTVFIISWKNPDAEDRELTLDDYRRLGIMEALEAIGDIVSGQKIHATGYCLGGTLLSIAAAAMSRNGDHRLASLSLLASQVDFTEPGELQLFINESQLAFLDSVMWKRGYLDTTEMAGAFQMLRSNDLIWSRLIHDYLMGERQSMIDLMAWNADATRMPYRMHSEYLRKLYLNNDFAEGRFRVDGRPVHVSDIRVPVFAVGTVKDHVAPWRSVFKIDALGDTDVTFALTSGGHNAGIVSEPGHPRRTFRVRSRCAEDLHVDPDTWLEETPEQDGSWWTAWAKWLDERSSTNVPPPPMGRKAQPPLGDAPGLYVTQK